MTLQGILQAIAQLYNNYIYVYMCYHLILCQLCTLDGLSIASRLSKRITIVTKQMKGLVSEFNEGLPSDTQMSWEAAINIHRQTYRASLTPNAEDLIPLEVKHEAVQKLKLLQRSEEEINLLKQEMKNCLEHFKERIKSLQLLQEQIILRITDVTDQFLLGSLCLVNKQLSYNESKLHNLRLLFRESIPGMYVTNSIH